MEQNPHLITPEQAENRICVQAMQRVKPYDHEATPCEGPRCMAWRWKETAEWRGGSDFVVTHSTTHGYCGLVRS